MYQLDHVVVIENFNCAHKGPGFGSVKKLEKRLINYKSPGNHEVLDKNYQLLTLWQKCPIRARSILVATCRTQRQQCNDYYVEMLRALDILELVSDLKRSKARRASGREDLFNNSARVRSARPRPSRRGAAARLLGLLILLTLILIEVSPPRTTHSCAINRAAHGPRMYDRCLRGSGELIARTQVLASRAASHT